MLRMVTTFGAALVLLLIGDRICAGFLQCDAAQTCPWGVR